MKFVSPMQILCCNHQMVCDSKCIAKPWAGIQMPSTTPSISGGVSEDSPGAVKLSESAEVLDLLLSIVYRLDRAKSNLRSADFNVLKAVAEAAEKYFFDMASGICEVYMWYALFSDLLPLKVTEFSVSPAQSTP